MQKTMIPVTTAVLDHVINFWPQFYRRYDILKDNTAAGMKFSVCEAE